MVLCVCSKKKKRKMRRKWYKKEEREKKNHRTNEQRNIYILRSSPYVTNTYVVPWHWGLCNWRKSEYTNIEPTNLQGKHSTRLLLLLMVLCSVLLIAGTADVVTYIYKYKLLDIDNKFFFVVPSFKNLVNLYATRAWKIWARSHTCWHFCAWHEILCWIFVCEYACVCVCVLSVASVRFVVPIDQYLRIGKRSKHWFYAKFFI